MNRTTRPKRLQSDSIVRQIKKTDKTLSLILHLVGQ